MRPEAKTHMGFGGRAIDIKLLWVGEDLWVPVRAGPHRDHHLSGINGYAFDSVILCSASIGALDRGVPAQCFLYHRWNIVRVLAQARHQCVISQKNQHGITNEISGGLVACKQDLIDDGQQLFRCQGRLTVNLGVHHNAQQVIGRLPTSLFNTWDKVVV